MARRLDEAAYSNVPPTCKCEVSEPIRTEVGIRCRACAKRLPQFKQAAVERAMAVRQQVDKTKLNKKHRT